MQTIALKTPIPGPKSQALLARRKAAVPQGPFNIAPIFVERGNGATVTDVDGNVFLDFSGGLGSLNAGHANPKVVEAVTKQAQKFLHTCFHIAQYEPYVCDHAGQVCKEDVACKQRRRSGRERG
jgi:4-aminobutyrate aminotransferase/(S)-3-amino-2-methylpropionate transaminase